MAATYDTRNWSAKEEHASHEGHDMKLVLKGEIQTRNTNEHPVLKEAVPQGINPRILMLVLEVPASGIGGDIVQWRSITFQKGMAAKQYDEVSIGGAVAKPVTVKVERVYA